MKRIDLDPHQYADVDRRTGKVKRRISKRFARNYGVGCLIVMGVIFWHRDDLSAGTLFGTTALFSVVAGIMLANWLFDLY